MTYNKQNRFMKNLIVRTVCLMICLSLSSIAIGQGKQITLPNVTNPFQGKKLSQKPVVIVPTMAKTDTIKKLQLKIENVNGSFYIDLSKENKTANSISKDFNRWFNLDENHTFQLLSTKTDEMQITHNYYQQYYKDYIVEGSILILHTKDGLVYAANGQIAEFSSIETQIGVSNQKAKNIAIKHTRVTEVLNEHPVETLICKIPSKNGFEYKFAHKIRIDSSNPFVQKDIYVDATTGKVVNVINLRIDIDTPATVSTMYSGTRTITTDSYSEGYRLRDNLRKIETYDATNSISNSVYSGAIDYTNLTTTWNNANIILSFVGMITCSDSWWLTPILDDKPEFYIKIKDDSNLIIYNGNNEYFNNTRPALPFKMKSLNLSTTGIYTIELWEYDSFGSDDFGGSFQLNLDSGHHTWSVNGNSGEYNIIVGNPAYDIHWGMEKSYDFYKNVFTRTSFDNAGSIIKNYVNPPDYQLQNGYSPNNAHADYETNLMAFGYGDGITRGAFASLDVVGHEFTHLIVKYRYDTSGTGPLNSLAYQGESGALNESFADIFGTCIEFETKPTTANWTMFEDYCLPNPSFVRSMSDPKSSLLAIDNRQPNTYQSPLSDGYWDNSVSPDVHTNSGVQNYWFYLLSQGGSGTNDIGNVYSVTGIGINKAREITYRNLTEYLGSNTATYIDSYNGSLLAAQALYGNPSVEYTAVKNAWYAVGIPIGTNNNPNVACSGITNLTASSGTFSDGSGNSNYGNNATCKWVIAPTGATQISLNFSAFNTESTYDIVTVYDGPTESYPVLATWWGNTLPPTITSTSGAMCVKFTTDGTTNFSGWSANYSSIITTPTCSGGTLLSTPSGSFNDGSISGNYTNNQQCYWYIAPPCATSVTLSFSQLDTEFNYDGVIIYDSLETTTPLAVFSGNTLPSSITSNTGIMLVVFVSDFANTYSGFTANYTSTGSSYCSGVTILNTSDYGTISDGSGSNNYCNNSNCSWLIQPPQATSVTLNFTAFELEPASIDGNSIYDAVEVYDGASASATLLGRYTGNNIPTTITSSGGSLYIRFYSDYADAYQGWSAYYTSTQNQYCNGAATTLTASSGSFSDGSGANKYANNSNCSWLIQPANATSITLSFNSFDTELNYDGVIVYDGTNSSAPVLGQFTGSTLPASLTSTGGNMYVSFLSDEALRANGWNASYTSTNSSGGGTTTYLLDRKVLSSAGKTQTAGSTIITWTLGEPIIGNMNAGSVKLTNGFHPLLTSQALEIQDHSIDFSIFIAPNPVTDYLNIFHKENHELNVKLFDITGKKLLEKHINASENKLDVSALPQGTYLIYVQDKLTNKTNTYKIIKN